MNTQSRKDLKMPHDAKTLYHATNPLIYIHSFDLRENIFGTFSKNLQKKSLSYCREILARFPARIIYTEIHINQLAITSTKLPSIFVIKNIDK